MPLTTDSAQSVPATKEVKSMYPIRDVRLTKLIPNTALSLGTFEGTLVKSQSRKDAFVVVFEDFVSLAKIIKPLPSYFNMCVLIK